MRAGTKDVSGGARDRHEYASVGAFAAVHGCGSGYSGEQ